MGNRTQNHGIGGMDGFTGKLILDTALSGDKGNDIAADMYKALSGNQTPEHQIAQANKIYKALGYKVGAIVQFNSGLGALGEIVSFNTSSSGLYSGNRYPINVKGPGGRVFEQSIFVSHYNEVPKYANNPEKLLVDFKDDIMVRVVENISNPKEIMKSQAAISDLNLYGVIDYLETYTPTEPKEQDLIYKYALGRIKYHWSQQLEMINTATTYIDSTDFEKIGNSDVKNTMIEMYMHKLSWHNELFGYNVATNVLTTIYRNIQHPTYKERIKNIITDRIAKLKDNELYTFTSEVKGTDLEQIGLNLLEERMQ